MNVDTYKKIHADQVARLKSECERMVSEGIIVAERYNPEWMEDCDDFIAHRCRSMAQKGFVQVLDEAVHQMAADYFNDELHGKWKGMKFEGLGECKNEEEDEEEEDEREDSGSMTKILEKEIADRNSELHALREESVNKAKKIADLEKNLKEAQKDLKSAQKDAEKAQKEAEKAKKAAEKYEIRNNPVKTEKKPTFVADQDQYDLFAMAGV